MKSKVRSSLAPGSSHRQTTLASPAPPVPTRLKRREVSSSGECVALASLTYVDVGAVTVDGFGTHLRAYQTLLYALPRFEFIYIAPSARLFQAAESEFHHVLYGRREQTTSVSILNYFRLRKAWDAKERVTSADVVLLKEAQLRYVGSNVETLYAKWRQGVVGDDEVMRGASQSVEPGKTTFRTLVCGSSLKVFSDSLECDVESWMERGVAREGNQESGQSPIQVPGL